MFFSQVSNSGDLVFIDSSGGMEEYNLRVFDVVTYSPVGALPLGLIITSDETTDTLTRAFTMYTRCLDGKSFYGRGGEVGPAVVMTDNCSELRDALRSVWSETSLLLCIFHLMQQLWRWLFDKKHGISAEHRPDILSLFKSVLYAKDVETMDECYETLTEDEVVVGYKCLVDYLSTLHDIRESWALAYRADLRIRGNNTNNPVEAQFLVLKDEVLGRTKEVNINGLLDKLVNEFNNHFKVKLLNVSSGKFDGCYAKRFKGKGKRKGELGFTIPTSEEQAKLLNEMEIVPDGAKVPSLSEESKTYTVNMRLGICECPIGYNGNVCKHQYVLWVSGKFQSFNFIPYLSWEERKKYATIAIGTSLPDEQYYGIHEYMLDKSDVDGATPDSDTHIESTNEGVAQEIATQALPRSSSRVEVDRFSADECKDELQEAHSFLQNLISRNANNRNFITGISKFCDRIQKYPVSKLASGFHSFGTSTSTSLKITAHALLKKAKGKTMHVQPDATRRRVNEDGSRRPKVKGMNVKNNPFNVEPARMREHRFSANTRENVPVSKKAGRNMASKTKHFRKKAADLEKEKNRKKESKQKKNENEEKRGKRKNCEDPSGVGSKRVKEGKKVKSKTTKKETIGTRNGKSKTAKNKGPKKTTRSGRVYNVYDSNGELL